MSTRIEAQLMYGSVVPDDTILPWDYDNHGYVDFDAWKKGIPGETCPITEADLFDFDDSHIVVIALKKSLEQAYLGEPVRVTPEVTDEDIRTAQEICNTHNIPFAKPGWLLGVSRY